MERINNCKSAQWSETPRPLTLVSPLQSILFRHFRHQVMSYSSQSQVRCQRSAKYLLCFFFLFFFLSLKVFQLSRELTVGRLDQAEFFAMCRAALSLVGGPHSNSNAYSNGINSTFSLSVSEPGHYTHTEGAAFQRRPSLRSSACGRGCWSKVDWQVKDLQLTE